MSGGAHRLYKYRSFDVDGYWEKIFSDQEFWFSTPEHLDDDEEVAIEWIPSHIREEEFEASIREGCSILSLARTADNKDLWNRYGDSCRGFCVEADFSAINSDPFLFKDVEYIASPAKVEVNYELICRFQKQSEKVIDEVWRKLYFQKRADPWAVQQECRFLHHEDNPPPNYSGRAASLPKEAIKTVYYIEDQISSENLKKLKDIISQYGDHVVLVSLKLDTIR